MINTVTLKRAGDTMMIVGGIIFGVGFGTTAVCNIMDYRVARNHHKVAELEREAQAAERERRLRAEKLASEARKNDLMSSKLESMSQKEFAKFHAEEVAKASDAAIAEANKIKASAMSKISEMKLECSEKVSKAVKEASEARTKYNELLAEYKSRNEVLKAKEDIKKFLQASETQKTEAAELKAKLSGLL